MMDTSISSVGDFVNNSMDTEDTNVVDIHPMKELGPLVVYGLSTEGFEIAKRILQMQPRVIIIDENSRLGIILTPEIAKEYSNISFLTDEELLLNLEPFDSAITNAPMIFFAPRIRKINQDVKNEIIQKFRELITFLRKDSVIVVNIPLGIGGNNEIITLIEHQSGLLVGKDIHYYYNPIKAHGEFGRIVLGSSYPQGKGNPFTNSILTHLNNYKPAQSGITASRVVSAEMNYSINVINKFSVLACINEMSRLTKSKDDKIEVFSKMDKQVYFDEIANGLFDLRMISHSLSSSTPLSYLVNGTIKSIEGYVKSLVDETRSQLKIREIKASRTKVTILWTIDNYEIRGDKTIIRELLESKLRDYIGEVEIQDSNNYIPNSLNNIIIACSNSDYERIINKMNSNINQHHPNYKIIVIAANSTFTTIEI
jgi:hypothetical protein